MKTFAVILAVLLIFGAAGCAGKTYNAPADSAAPRNQNSYGSVDSAGFDEVADREISFNHSSSASGGTSKPEMFVSEEQNSIVSDQALSARKIVYSSDFSIQTTSFDKASASLDELCETYGAYYERSETYGSAENASRSSSYTIRVPVENYKAFRSAAGTIGTVVHSAENNADVTEKYFDTEARLESAKIREERLLDILRTAESLDNVLLLESELADVRYEIESLSGTLRKYDSLVSYSTINIHLEEVYKPVAVQTMPKTFGDRMARAFTNGWNDFTDALQNTAVTLSYYLPNIVVFLVFVLVIFLIVKIAVGKAKKKRRSETPASSPAVNPLSDDSSQTKL